tara:strand:- start:45768 stop:46079 length:312 start_codon:yes stop_codon:yes gene_type:complete
MKLKNFVLVAFLLLSLGCMASVNSFEDDVGVELQTELSDAPMVATLQSAAAGVEVLAIEYVKHTLEVGAELNLNKQYRIANFKRSVIPSVLYASSGGLPFRML